MSGVDGSPDPGPDQAIDESTDESTDQPTDQATDQPPDVAPTDPDVELRDPRQRAELTRHPIALVGTVAAGGVLGAEARYGLGLAFPTADSTFPWTTFGINVTGCLLIGVLMAILARRQRHPAVRLFLGVGVLGGYTTFSTYVVDIVVRLHAGHVAVAFGYLAGTLVAALLAVLVGSVLGSRLDSQVSGAGRRVDRGSG